MEVLAACSRFRHWERQESGRLVERQLASSFRRESFEVEIALR